MKKQEKYQGITNAYENKKRDDGTEYISLKDEQELGKELHKAIFDIQMSLEDGRAGFELSYNIMQDACYCISDIELAELEKAEFETETASVYTADRLAYLNIHNQADITDKLKEYDLDDIGTACAVWYDEQVRNACEQLREYILAD